MENIYSNSFNQTRIPVFSPGDKIYCEEYKKSGKIVALRDDNYERKERQKDPHRELYYHVQFVDNSFDTYIPASSLFKIWIS